MRELIDNLILKFKEQYPSAEGYDISTIKKHMALQQVEYMPYAYEAIMTQVGKGIRFMGDNVLEPSRYGDDFNVKDDFIRGELQYTPFILPSDAFLYFDNSDYYLFFRTLSGDNPPVYGYFGAYPGFFLATDRFSDFLEDEMLSSSMKRALSEKAAPLESRPRFYYDPVVDDFCLCQRMVLLPPTE